MKPALALTLAAFVVSGLDASKVATPLRATRVAEAPVVPTPPLTTPVAGAPVVRVVRYGDDRLSGITAVDVVVNATNADACGLSQSAVQEAAVAALRAAGITASASAKASSWFYTVYVTAESAAADGHCVTAVRGELMAQVSGIPDADRAAPQDAWGSLLVGEMPLVRQSVLVSSNQAEHAAQVHDAVREQLTAIGARIKTVNATR